MKKEIAQQWVAALRSGKYQQGTGALKIGDKYCCLGVLCDISDQATWEVDTEYPLPDRNDKIYEYFGVEDVLPDDVMRWAGMQSNSGVIPGLSEAPFDKTKLVFYNDDLEYTFNQIADIIEENWEHL